MRFKVTALVVFVVMLCLVAFSAHCAEHRLGDQVSGGVKLTSKEMAAIEPSLAHYYAMDGSKPIIVRVIETADAVGCREACLTEVTGLMVRLMKAGIANDQVGNEVVTALRAVESRCDKRGIEAKGPEISRAVRTRVEGKYKNQNGVVF